MAPESGIAFPAAPEGTIRARRLSAGAWAAGLAAGAVLRGQPPDSIEKAAGALSLNLRFPPAVEIASPDFSTPPEADAGQPAPRTFWVVAASVGTVLGSAWNSFGDGPNVPWHLAHEEWFGRNTYAGGADKAYHFVSYNAVSRLLTRVYEDLHMAPENAQWLAFGVSTFAGLVTEIGDGTTRYGFSYEDFVLDLAGTATALATAHFGAEDLVGFRAGLVPAPRLSCCLEGAFGFDYSKMIATADLKIVGVARRVHWRPGPARFLLVSVTYGAKGYPYAAPPVRERQIGIEIGLHPSEILRAAGVPETPWWGHALYFVFDTIRFPYTSVGFQYDVNHRKWRGPGIGDRFPGAGR